MLYLLFSLSAIAATNATSCALIKTYEPICCPSKSDVKLPPVTKGDTCCFCGSADIAMTKPNAPMMAFGGDEGEGGDDGTTCSQVQASITKAKQTVGTTCKSSLNNLHLFTSPSVCGCEGFSPPNKCQICGSGSVINRTATIPNEEDVACGSISDVLQHLTEGGCAALTGSGAMNLDNISEACCIPTSSPTTSSAYGLQSSIFSGLVFVLGLFVTVLF